MSAAELGRLSMAEFGQLQAEWNRREQRMDMRFGLLLALLANVHRDPKRSGEFHPADFFASLEEFRPAPPPPEELERKLIAAFTFLGG